MPRLLSYALLVAAAVAVVVATLARPQPPPERVYDGFPARLDATAPSLPSFADGPSTRVVQQMASLEAMWTKAFAAAGDTYERPEFADRPSLGCTPSGSWAGLYCPGHQIVVIDLPAHLRRHAAVGGGLADLALGYIVAHEVGHHVQLLRGAPRDASPASTLRRELQADCLAGVWGKAARLPLPPLWIYGSDADHGTQTQRIQWTNRGYAGARPADCDAVWATPPARL